MPGEKAAVELALESAPIEEFDEPEQLDLIGAPESARVISLRKKRLAKDGSNRGRNPGARNKRVTDYANFLLSRYGSPLEVLAQIAVMRVDELSASIGCDKLAALQEKRLAAIALTPYVHQKMPLAVNVNERVVHLHLDLGDAGDDGESEGMNFTAQIVEAIARDADNDE